MNVLSVKGLCKSYPGFSLQNVSFEIKDKEFVIITGTSGSGSIADRIAAVQGDTESTIADVEAIANQNQTDLNALTGRVTALDHTTTGRVTKVENDLSALQETVAGNHTAALNAA